jgi:enoyl-CoA hydratase/carnithine racemase
MSKTVAVTRDGPVTHIQLVRTDKLNAFSGELVEDLHAALDDATSSDARLVVFSGAGKGFSGGFDLAGLESLSDGDLLLRLVRLEELLQAVYYAPVPTLALAHGPCYGAAADLVVACHRRVAAPGTRFRMPGLKFDAVLGTRRLANTIGADQARRLLRMSAPFDEQTARDVGFIQDIADQQTWPDIIEQAREEALGLSPAAQRSLSARTAVDTRAEDMVALVRSVSTGSIKGRIESYLAELKSVRKT